MRCSQDIGHSLGHLSLGWGGGSASTMAHSPLSAVGFITSPMSFCKGCLSIFTLQQPASPRASKWRGAQAEGTCLLRPSRGGHTASLPRYSVGHTGQRPFRGWEDSVRARVIGGHLGGCLPQAKAIFPFGCFLYFVVAIGFFPWVDSFRIFHYIWE